jgi:hypothetical protein
MFKSANKYEKLDIYNNPSAATNLDIELANKTNSNSNNMQLQAHNNHQRLIDEEILAKQYKSTRTKQIIIGLVIAALVVVAAVGWAKALSHHDAAANIPNTVSYGASYTIGPRMILPSDGDYVHFTILQMNDVYELLPLNNGQTGGLARVATIRKLLKQENSNTVTMLAGDLISPSALATATILIDGKNQTMAGRQMIAAMNELGLNFSTFGNHGELLLSLASLAHPNTVPNQIH